MKKVMLITVAVISLIMLAVGCSSEIYWPDGNSPWFDTSGKKEGEDIIDFLSRNGYAITWADEFDGDELNLDYWNFEVGQGTNGWGNWEAQYYSANETEVFLRDGNLNIVANKVGNTWLSGRIKTQRRMQFKYGYIEARLLLPEGSGMWPAFWLLGCDSEDENRTYWPQTGEFDIMEYSPATQGENRVYSTLHTQSNNGGNGYGLGDKVFSADEIKEYHRYGLLWTNDFIEVYYDGNLIGRKDRPGNTVEEWPFNTYEAFVLLNLAIGGQLGGDVPEDAVRYEYLIDYVRLYQRDGEVLHEFY